MEGIPEVMKMAEIIVPVLTPFNDGKINIELLKEHTSSLLKAGVDRIFVNGTTGMALPYLLGKRRPTLRQCWRSQTR
ncbi:dihydrodipicolinate synthase family protein [Sulfuracidifex tepidarius]|uniref:dihydrodipicolinate synthase family protein n=1 Tax=Sulfuracidifex tepidarius TaxID=1294262 RepID=UPI0021087EB5|nr:dihydrodipicolinate synthase family protein [Sulfuracidifex tepidarius]